MVKRKFKDIEKDDGKRKVLLHEEVEDRRKKNMRIRVELSP